MAIFTLNVKIFRYFSLLTLFFIVVSTAACTPAIPCSQTNNPAACQALLDLTGDKYNKGASKKSGWQNGPDLCTWEGITCTNGAITGLDFASLDITDVPPGSLDVFATTVQNINFYGNNITTLLPGAIDRIQTLTTVNLGCDKTPISTTAAIALPISTTTLYLHGCQLTSLPKGLSPLPNLQYLYIDGNYFTTFVEDMLAPYPKLLGVSATRCRLTSIPARFLSYTPLMTSFVVSANEISGFASTFLDATPKMSMFDISYNLIEQCPFDFIGNSKNLTWVNLDHNPWQENSGAAACTTKIRNQFPNVSIIL